MIGIYKFENKINGKVYIGQSVNIEKRYSEHLRVNNKDKSIFHFAIRKYGLDNFSFEIIEECEPQKLDELEIMYIQLYKSLHPQGYNLTSGGRSKWKTCLETKEKIKKAKTGIKCKPFTQEHKDKIAFSKIGSKNPMFDRTVFDFTHSIFGFKRCTKYELSKEYNLDSGHLNKLCKNSYGYKSVKGWKILTKINT